MSTHTWRFFRAGGVDQVRLETSDDLRNLASLDQKLWVALACPVVGLEIDPRLMALIDTDVDGRVRAPEVRAAVDFVVRHLREPADILAPRDALALASIRDDAAEPRKVLASARAILEARGKPDAATITVADVADHSAAFVDMPLNGDGVVTEVSTTDEATLALIRDILATVGGVPDRSGKPGVDTARVDAFFADCAAYSAWHGRAEAAVAGLLPIGRDGIAGASAALAAVRAKVDDYFARVRFAEFDARGIAALNGTDAEVSSLAARALSAGCSEAEGFPLAQVAPGRALPLTSGVNPAWSARIDALRTAAITPLLGDRAVLTEQDWASLKVAFAAYEAWDTGREGAAVASLGLDRIAALLAGDTKAPLLALIAADEEQRAAVEAIGDVERLVRYHAGLGKLLRNFVNFAEFYGRAEPALFQAGTVYFDQRSCDLVVQVNDAGRHAAMAGLSGAYLAYLDCTRKIDGRTLGVCVAVTDGDGGDLMVGRNGLFYDRKGRDYDATITRIVSNPISLREAFWSPYIKFLRAIEDFVAKRAAAAEAESDAAVTRAAETVATADKAAAAPAEANPSKFDVGTVAALGVAVGGIIAALGAILQVFFGLGMWMPLGFVGLVLLISGPSMLLAALKLRRRSIGAILDADGWALNTQARVNIPFGRSLTRLAALPPGSRRDLADPFAQKKSPWPYVIAVFLVLGLGTYGAYRVGFIPPLPGTTPTAEAAPAAPTAGAGAAAEPAPAATPAP